MKTSEILIKYVNLNWWIVCITLLVVCKYNIDFNTEFI